MAKAILILMTEAVEVELTQQLHSKSLVVQQALEHAKFFLALYKQMKLNESIK